MAAVVFKRPKPGVGNGQDKSGKKNENDNAPNERKIYGVYIRSMLDTKVTLMITEIGKNVGQLVVSRLRMKKQP